MCRRYCFRIATRPDGLSSVAMTYEDLPDEWKDWLALTPIERLRRASIGQEARPLGDRLILLELSEVQRDGRREDNEVERLRQGGRRQRSLVEPALHA